MERDGRIAGHNGAVHGLGRRRTDEARRGPGAGGQSGPRSNFRDDDDETLWIDAVFFSLLLRAKDTLYLTLRELGLVTDRREGLWIHYRVNPDLPEWIGDILRATSQGLESQPPFAADAEALTSINDESGVQRCAPSGG